MEIDELIFVMSNQKSIERKTAAIMFTDIAGYTEAMSQSEQKALEMLRKKRTIIKTLIGDHNGEYVKEIGDGTLSYFNSGFNASSCAKELQKEVNKEDLKVRVGIHIGDIVFDNNDVYGDGVNIASRLESLAPAGGVLVSRNVYDELINKDGFDSVPLGLQSLKGVGRLVEVYGIKDEYLVIPKLDEYKDTEIETHKDDEVPSLAILPFENKGSDEDIFYAYGISSDLVSDITSAGQIKVASQRDIDNIDYKKYTNIKIASMLSVRYIVSGELWKMNNLFQLSIELYDTKERRIVWSDRWQESWENLSNIKSNLSDGLLKTFDKKLVDENKTDRSNPKAYEMYLKAKHEYYEARTSEKIEYIEDLLKTAINIDENSLESKLLLCSLKYDNYGVDDDLLSSISESIKKSIKLKDIKMEARFLNLLGHYYAEVDKTQKSLSLANDSYDRSIAKAKLIKDDLHVAKCNHNKALLMFQRLNDVDEALDLATKSLNFFKSVESYYDMGNGSSFVGSIYFSIFDIETAKQYFTDSLNFRKKIGGYRTEYSFWNLAECYEIEGKYSKAIENYYTYLKAARDLGKEKYLVNVYYRLGVCQYLNNNHDKSHEYLSKSISLQDENSSKELIFGSKVYTCLVHDNTLNEDDLTILRKDFKDFDFEIYFHLYELHSNNVFLEHAFNKIKDRFKVYNDEIKSILMKYPIPRKVIEAYEKV